ncbi:radical SAM protein [Desulfuromonas carbonis]|uniref:radical SAM protein n=1 Tax=Desulfuromonas sp. DDH964 TaxID=1823759 RepID=UPI00078DC65D|nr:radical SAM protein [Desulfuromonas sp. DDH964]AMV71715.1 ribosomal RNA large subunit methyltransferase N [Desulfuromonas sp. DDH964]
MTDDFKNIRLAVPLADGLSVEAVYYGSGTLCLSTQAGCALACPFCASGRNGLHRNLRVDELISQVELFRAGGMPPRRLTLSGIGEPLHNFAVVREFIEASDLPVSLTTTGGPLVHLAAALPLPHNGLMLSLHAGSAAVHRQLLPRAPQLEELVACVDHGLASLSRRARRRIGINYLLLEGVNDCRRELDALLQLLGRWPETTLHLLACNPVPGSPFSSPGAEGFNAVYSYLAERHSRVRRPNRWRRQAEGGCGTLVLQEVGAPLFSLAPEVS